MARRLDEILKSDPNVRVVRLEYEGLADLTPLMPVLSVLPNLMCVVGRWSGLPSVPVACAVLTRACTRWLCTSQRA